MAARHGCQTQHVHELQAHPAIAALGQRHQAAPCTQEHSEARLHRLCARRGPTSFLYRGPQAGPCKLGQREPNTRLPTINTTTLTANSATFLNNHSPSTSSCQSPQTAKPSCKAAPEHGQHPRLPLAVQQLCTGCCTADKGQLWLSASAASQGAAQAAP